MTLPCDVFVALSSADVTAIATALAEGLGGDVARISVATTDGTHTGAEPWPERCESLEGPVETAFETALERAADASRALLVVLAPLRIVPEAISTLFEVFDEDPMFGVAVPRVGTADGTAVLPIPSDETCSGELLDRRVLGQASAVLIAADLLAPCFLVRAEVVGSLEETRAGEPVFGVAVEHYLARIRRLGYRTAVTNRAVVGCLAPYIAPEASAPRDRRNLYERFPAVGRARREYGLSGRRRFEVLYSHLIRGGSPPSLLLDVRNLGAHHNGTSYAALGLCEGIRQHAKEWPVGLLAGAEARAFHELDGRFPGWAVHEAPPSQPYGVGLRLSQPWHLTEIRDLHQAAFVNCYLMLDTIAWDVVYAAPERLDATWACAARHADALLFISDYSRDRFLVRFPESRDRRLVTCRLSCDPRDYHRGASGGGRQHLLIIGNDLDHKSVGPVARLLTGAFPYDRIVAVGATRGLPRTVQTLASGLIPESELDELYANAWAIVFPSHYEGFGFPVVHGLAAGVPVLARRSALLQELADHYRGPGQLIGFGSSAELVEALGHLKHGEPVAGYALGAAVAPASAPEGWTAAGARLLALARELAGTPEPDTWLHRERMLRLLQ